MRIRWRRARCVWAIEWANGVEEEQVVDLATDRVRYADCGTAAKRLAHQHEWKRRRCIGNVLDALCDRGRHAVDRLRLIEPEVVHLAKVLLVVRCDLELGDGIGVA